MPGASDALTNPQFHGVSQVLYEFTSSSANNGSGFEGLGRQYGILEHFNRHCDVACTIYSIVLQILIVSSLVNKRPISNILKMYRLIIYFSAVY